jgi:hypothetical protein
MHVAETIEIKLKIEYPISIASSDIGIKQQYQ